MKYILNRAKSVEKRRSTQTPQILRTDGIVYLIFYTVFCLKNINLQIS